MDFEWEEPETTFEETEETEVEEETGAEPGQRRRRRRRRKVTSPEHEARIARYRGLVEERGWIFAPPSPPQPLSYLFDELTQQQIESLSA
ncbi:MAG: hypothetical protein AB7N76_21795 [Planctomycetota bacterium]